MDKYDRHTLGILRKAYPYDKAILFLTRLLREAFNKRLEDKKLFVELEDTIGENNKKIELLQNDLNNSIRLDKKQDKAFIHEVKRESLYRSIIAENKELRKREKENKREISKLINKNIMLTNNNEHLANQIEILGKHLE